MSYLIFVLSFYCSTCFANIANSILNTYQSEMYALPIIQQEHFAVRMYNITGNEHYLNPIINYLYVLSERYKYLTKHLHNPNIIAHENKRLLSIHQEDSEKAKARIKRSLQFPNIAYYLNLLVLTNKVYFYHLENSPLFYNASEAVDFLKAQKNDLKKFILNKYNIQVYGPQLINYVYYLKDLKIIDLRQAYTRQFQKIFPDSLDNQLSDMEFSAKIYGMSHFITAASHYYQTDIDSKPFHWIIDYFQKHIHEIIRRGDNDLIAEVGVCLLLCKDRNENSIQIIKSYLNTVYNVNHHMIPKKDQSIDFVQGEHRNILTIMMFNWPDKLHPVPKSLLQTMLAKNFILNDNGLTITYGFRELFK